MNQKTNFSKFEKIFFTAVVSKLLNESSDINFLGSQQEADVILEALEASRNFHDELNREGTTVSAVVTKLGEKHVSTTKFEKTFGVPWLL